MQLYSRKSILTESAGKKNPSHCSIVPYPRRSAAGTARSRGAARRARGGGAPPGLTADGGDERVAVLDHVLDELVGALQLLLVALEPLSEVGAVQVAVAELQRLQPHGCAAPRRAPLLTATSAAISARPAPGCTAATKSAGVGTRGGPLPAAPPPGPARPNRRPASQRRAAAPRRESGGVVVVSSSRASE